MSAVFLSHSCLVESPEFLKAMVPMLHWRPTKPDSLVIGSRQVVLRSTALMESSTFMQHANICLWFLILDQHLPHP